jgi:hypothetical protein
MRTLIIAALLLLHGAAYAQQAKQPVLSYSFGEIRYVDVDDGGNGFELGGSFQFNASWFGVASLSSLDFGSGVDVTSFEIGAGYVAPLRDNWDLQANARIIRTEVDTRFGNANDTGIGLLGGVRGLLVPKLELRGNVHYVNVDESDVFLEVAGDWYITPQFAAGLSVEFGGDVDLWTIGARYYFK